MPGLFDIEGELNEALSVDHVDADAECKRLDHPGVVRRLRIAADLGSAEAQWELGNLYRFGHKDVSEDHSEAVRWFQRAAEQGHAEAQARLGFMYLHGWGVAEDHGEAARWLRQAAEQGNADGQERLGILYRDGNIVPQDYVAAYKWLILAAAQGRNDPLDEIEELAERMTRGQIAEAQRVAGEQVDIGLMQHHGEGEMTKYHTQADGDPTTEVDWDNANAQEQLANLYTDSNDHPEDAYVTAHACANLAASQGSTEAIAARDAIAELMTKEQIADAQKAARASWGHHVDSYMWLVLAAAHGQTSATEARDAMAELLTADQIAYARHRARTLWDRIRLEIDRQNVPRRHRNSKGADAE